MRPAEIEPSEGSHRWDNEAQGIGDSILQRWFNVERITRGWFQWGMETQSLQGTQKRKEGRKKGKEGR